MNVDTQNHLAILRGMLVFELDEASAELRALQRTDVPAREHEVSDRQEEAAAAEASERDDAALQRVTLEVAQCQRALERLDQERYGDCADCGESIPWPRLMAQPAAERCADCQRLVEGAAHR